MDDQHQMNGQDDGESVRERASCSYANLSERFVTKERKFTCQYSQIYSVRLMEMRGTLEAVAKRKWGLDVPIKKLMDLKTGERCVIVGTIFKRMELKPSILKDISGENDVLPLPPRDKCIDSTDSLVLEDSSQRITLIGNIGTQEAVTGTLMAVLGCALVGGEFDVEDTSLCGLMPPPETRLDDCVKQEPDKYVALISGLNVGDSKCDQLALQLFVDFVTGQLGSTEDQQACSNIVRVILVGNSVAEAPRSSSESKLLSRKVDAGTVNSMKELDDVLVQLVENVSVDVMPGTFDPTNYTLPQQPLHRCMFPQAAAYSTFNSVTNPYECDIGGVRFLGTSGQSVDDIFRFSSHDDRMAILDFSLQCGHLVPTAPDTLGCYPFYKSDPFIIKHCPHIYFAGNQPGFQAKHVTGSGKQNVLLLLLPCFVKSQSCVLVNLRTLEHQEVHVSTAMGFKDVGTDECEPMELS